MLEPNNPQHTLLGNTALQRLTGGIVLLSRLLILLTSIRWLDAGHFSWFLVGAVSFSLTFMPCAPVRDQGLRAATEVFVALFLGAHIFLGMHLGWYTSSELYDKLVHALSTSAITAVTLTATRDFCHRRQLWLPRAVVILWALGMAISVGALWEIFEFAMDSTGLFFAQRGLQDTMLDLIADAAGALATLAVYAVCSSRNVFIR